MILVIIFVVTILMGVPIAFVLGLTTLTHMIMSGDVTYLNMLSQRLMSGVSNYSLLAIPFFILAGEVMSTGGTAKRLVDVARVFVGFLKGGLAYVNIVASALLAAIMGSAVAESAAMAKIMQPSMEEDGYDPGWAACLTAAASTMGPVIPPSMVFVVYGVTAGCSIGKMFFGGIIPGICMAAAFSCVVFFSLRHNNTIVVSKRMNFKESTRALLNGIPALMVPLIILGGICTGLFTATESAIIASAWALFLGCFIYKEIKLKDLGRIFLNTATSSALIMMIMGIANIFGWSLAIENVPNAVAGFITGISSSKLVILLLLNVILLFIGCVMEGTAAMIILVPVLLPICTSLGMDPVQFGLIICFNLIIGLITPPVGLCLYSTAATAKVKVEYIYKGIWPYVAASALVLILVTYWEDFSMLIPNLIFK